VLPLKKPRAWLVALLVALVAALVGSAPVAGAPNDKASYVALGDSFTAGPLIPLQIPPPGCLKSNRNYPHLVAPLGQPVFRDASCSGAETEDMTSSQDVDPDPDPPPQFSALDSHTEIVTIGIGGNDIGFSEIARNCTSPTPEGHPCQDRYVHDGRDEIHERIVQTAPKVAAVLRGIHRRSPKADVYVVNYLPIFPEEGPGCWPQVPVTAEDVDYLRRKQIELNAMLADMAAANDAKIFDAYTAGIGRDAAGVGAGVSHDACQLPTPQRWVEPAAPNFPAAPLHPNQFGMEGTADVLRAAVPQN
jgi:lysophospholipase L1-like esterase